MDGFTFSTTTMKFVALALALFLAVGSQAASLQADAPSQLTQLHGAVHAFMQQAVDSSKRAVGQLDDAQYGHLKAELNNRIDQLRNTLKSTLLSVEPLTNSFVSTIVDATTELRANLNTDLDNLRADLSPKVLTLREVLQKHLDEYREKVEPLVTEYRAKHEVEMALLRDKVEPVVTELRTKVETNWDETKTALKPILDTLDSKIRERLETLKGLAAPYVEEYKEQLRQVYTQAGDINSQQMVTLKEKLEPMLVDLKTNLNSIFQAIAESVNQN